MKFDWLPSVCAPLDYPIRMVDGYFITAEGNVKLPSIRGVYNNGWGNVGPIAIVGEDLKAMPQEVVVKWMSIVEKKFYEGRFPLPTEEIEALLQSGFYDLRKGKQDKYNYILIGLAPGGVMSVWIAGSSKTIEICQFVAPTVESSMKELNPTGMQDMDKYVSGVLQRLPETVRARVLNEAPSKKWQKEYRKTFHWKPVVQWRDKVRANNLTVRFFDGEEDLIPWDESELTKVPRYMTFRWQNEQGNGFGADIVFGEENEDYLGQDVLDAEMEIFESFEKLQEGNDQAIELRIMVDKYNSNITLQLVKDDRFLDLTKPVIRVYELTNN